jgi:3',5'-cyclic AMP phosphodiesterase CpdA
MAKINQNFISDHKPLPEPIFAFAVVTDGHINPEEDLSSSPWESNRMANGRNRYVVHKLNQLKPDFVVHMGDLIHPIPSQPAYSVAARRFHDIYQQLECPIHLMPGNHDVGDKPSSWTPAEIVNEGFLAQFEKHFARCYSSFDHQSCHFILLNSQLFNTGLKEEETQRCWLEEDLDQNRHKRIFMFTHYPPFLTSHKEEEHYDNLSEPARSWLLDLLDRYKVTALFSGHVHSFFYNRYGVTDFYVLPSITFFRHDYSELFRVGAAEEHGRNDLGKFGFFFVKVYQNKHTAHCIRTWGQSLDTDKTREPAIDHTVGVHTNEMSWPGLGIDMRHPWAEITEFPYSGALDEFLRKKVRNDYPMWALWEMGARRLRLPLHDLTDERVRARLADLKIMGHQVCLFIYDLPSPEMVKTFENHQELLESIEIIIPWANAPQYVEGLTQIRKQLNVPIYLSKLRSSADVEKEGGRFKHFIKHGFSASEQNVIEDFLKLNGASSAVDGFVFRVDRSAEPFVDIPAAVDMTQRLGLNAQFQVALANENPAVAENDDAANANRVAETLAVALALPQTTVILDTFVDMDRGYFPRTGLVDRRYNPRMAGDVYRNLNARLGPHSKKLVASATQKVAGGKICILKSPECLWVLVLPEDELILSELNLTAFGVTELENATCSDLADGRNFKLQLQKENDRLQSNHERNGNFKVRTPILLRLVI